MKSIFILMVAFFIACTAWAGDETPVDAPAEQTPPSTLFMSLREVQKIQAHEQAEEALNNPPKNSGLPPAPPPLPERQAGWPEKLVSGIVKGAAHNESLTNPDRDLRPKPEPVKPYWRGADDNLSE